MRRRDFAVIEREQVRLEQVARERREREKRGAAAAAKAKSSARATASEEASTMRALATPGHPLRVIALACLEVARANAGEVDLNKVREITRPGGDWVPALDGRGNEVSGFYADLRRAGLLRRDGVIPITGHSGNNNGRGVGLHFMTQKGYRVLRGLPAAPWAPDTTATAAERLAAEIDPTHDDTDRLFADLMDGDE